MWKDWKIVKWLESKGGRKSISEASPSKKKKNIIKKIGLAFVGQTSGRENFKGPDGFDFDQIEMAYLTDSYIRMAMDKYVDFMFKAGWDIVGKNPKTVEYINQRFAAMSHGTQIPTEQLLIDIAEEIVKYHNVFVIKARAPNGYTYPPGVRATPAGDSKKPVAGYFILPCSTIEIDRDKNGTVKKYKQEVEGGEKPLKIPPNDMIHMYVDKLPGRAFGYPFLWEVLDDVKLLRQMEELVDRLVYKNIFPTYVYQVGLEKDGFQSTDGEIEDVKEMLGELSLDGGLVMPERHKLYAVGAEGKALNVSDYLKYFEDRVFTGLGVSGTLMGRGNTANKSTSDNMDAAFKDRIKAYQKVISTFINNFMINELLMEGGYDPILQEKDRVEFRFKEIDFDSKIKEENHAIQKFTQNAISHEELREILGCDPVTDENRLYFKMITATLEQTKAANNAGDNKDQPANQHGKKTSPKKESIKESFRSKNSKEMYKSLKLRWDLTKAEITDGVKKFYSDENNQGEKFDITTLNTPLNLTITSMMPVFVKYIRASFMEGSIQARSEANYNSGLNISYDKNTELLSHQIRKSLEKLLVQDLVYQVDKAIGKESKVDKIAGVMAAFDSLEYRLKFMSTTEAMKAYNEGFAKAARIMGHKEAYVNVSDKCEECKSYESVSIDLFNGSLPPFHPNCTCKLTLVKKEGS